MYIFFRNICKALYSVFSLVYPEFWVRKLIPSYQKVIKGKIGKRKILVLVIIPCVSKISIGKVNIPFKVYSFKGGITTKFCSDKTGIRFKGYKTENYA